MSQHIITNAHGKFVFGWDQPLQSFFLQLHKNDVIEDENPVVWLGATAASKIYEVEELVTQAWWIGLDIPKEIQTKLYAEKDDGI